MTEAAVCDHKWREYTEEEMTTLRSQTRQGRPSGAGVEGAEQCESCGAVQAKVSWWGQVHKVPFAPKQEGGQPVIRELKRVSTPGLRKYVGVTDIPRVRNGLGMAIVSTSRGLMSDAQARRANTGGELLALVW